LTHLADFYHVRGWTSGYGITEAVNYLKSKAENKEITVLVRSATGNPEDAVLVYLRKHKNINTDYLGDSVCSGQVKQDLKRFKEPIYFVSRDREYGGNEPCLNEEIKFFKPDGKSFVGVYKFIKKE
jgi:hypothetical protein